MANDFQKYILTLTHTIYDTPQRHLKLARIMFLLFLLLLWEQPAATFKVIAVLISLILPRFGLSKPNPSTVASPQFGKGTQVSRDIGKCCLIIVAHNLQRERQAVREREEDTEWVRRHEKVCKSILPTIERITRKMNSNHTTFPSAFQVHFQFQLWVSFFFLLSLSLSLAPWLMRRPGGHVIGMPAINRPANRPPYPKPSHTLPLCLSISLSFSLYWM